MKYKYNMIPENHGGLLITRCEARDDKEDISHVMGEPIATIHKEELAEKILDFLNSIDAD